MEHWPLALYLIDEMACVGQPLSNGRAVAAAVTAVGKAGLWQDALALMARCGPTLNEFVILLMGQHKDDYSLLVNKYPTLCRVESPDRVLYNAALDACAVAGRWRKALTLLEAMELKGACGVMLGGWGLGLANAASKEDHITLPRWGSMSGSYS